MGHVPNKPENIHLELLCASATIPRSAMASADVARKALWV